MTKNNYIPRPADTSEITLASELTELIEAMAMNVHEVWATSRIAEGWQYGDTRDDARKQHPCLMPYNELPENEKEYDRKTAVETLKLIQQLGFTIEKGEK